MPIDKLTDAKIRQAKPAKKPYKLFDGGGLFLVVQANGSKLVREKSFAIWRCRNEPCQRMSTNLPRRCAKGCVRLSRDDSLIV